MSKKFFPLKKHSVHAFWVIVFGLTGCRDLEERHQKLHHHDGVHGVTPDKVQTSKANTQLDVAEQIKKGLQEAQGKTVVEIQVVSSCTKNQVDQIHLIQASTFRMENFSEPMKAVRRFRNFLLNHRSHMPKHLKRRLGCTGLTEYRLIFSDQTALIEQETLAKNKAMLQYSLRFANFKQVINQDYPMPSNPMSSTSS